MLENYAAAKEDEGNAVIPAAPDGMSKLAWAEIEGGQLQSNSFTPCCTNYKVYTTSSQSCASLWRTVSANNVNGLQKLSLVLNRGENGSTSLLCIKVDYLELITGCYFLAMALRVSNVFISTR